jgi:hypothetical protein
LQLKAEHSGYAPVSKFLKLGFSDAVQHAISALPPETDIVSPDGHVRYVPATFEAFNGA